ncbi:hypothetical protein D3C73_1378520 [compost metagenome]
MYLGAIAVIHLTLLPQRDYSTAFYFREYQGEHLVLLLLVASSVLYLPAFAALVAE